MECLIRFIHMHESFRQPETNALAELHSLQLEWLAYSPQTPFAVVRLRPLNGSVADAARLLVSRSILIYAIYELWGQGQCYRSLHADVKRRSSPVWDRYHDPSFRFELDCFQGSRSSSEQRDIMDSFAYLDFQGPILMRDAEYHFTIFEDFELRAPSPRNLYFGKRIAESGRQAVAKYNLKTRKYIATTSMDAELSLVTANMALAGPGRLSYDPFMGTGSFPLACAHFGSSVFGSDMDGRSIRGKKGRSVRANFEQYRTSHLYLGAFAADLTNTPVREQRFLDSIVCDPPYGVREGLKVLGSTKEALQREVLLASGVPAHLADGYIPPKKPYSFLRMLDDILDFGARTLSDRGRLCMWMPVAGVPNENDDNDNDNDDGTSHVDDTNTVEAEYAIPQHPALQLVAVSTQEFTKWSRRLLTYRRLPDEDVEVAALSAYHLHKLTVHSEAEGGRGTADQLNDFRRKYFAGFKNRAEDHIARTE